jgi:hypothetical protein
MLWGWSVAGVGLSACRSRVDLSQFRFAPAANNNLKVRPVAAHKVTRTLDRRYTGGHETRH